MTPEIITYSVIAGLGVIAGGFLWYRGKRAEVLRVISRLVDLAEEKFGSGTGEIKYDFVIARIYPLLPVAFRLIVSPAKLDEWLESAVRLLQRKIEEKKANL